MKSKTSLSNRLKTVSLIICISLGLSAIASPIEGRWDMTVDFEGMKLPSWLEVRHSGSKRLIGEFVGFGGSARPVSKVIFENDVMRFTVPPQWEAEDRDFEFEGTLKGDVLVGTMVASNGKTYKWTARRAPSLVRDKQPEWDQPITLFDGKSLNGWHPTRGTNQWVAENGILSNKKSGANLITDQSFGDFKLHIEFRYPAESNSGVYLRGRYEVQVIDCFGQEPQKDLLGAVYGFIKPNENVVRKPGEWQSYDITLIGRRVSIVANGKQIVCDAEIPGITGGALDSNEGTHGPFMLQGDHGAVEYRNIVVTPAKK